MLGKWVSSFYSMVDFGCSKYIHVLYCMLPEMFRAGKNFEVKITLFFDMCNVCLWCVCMCTYVCMHVEATSWREGFFQRSLCLLRRSLLLSPLCLLGAAIAGGQWDPPGFSVCAGDLNSGSHVFIASASSTELSPPPQTAWTLKWRSPSFRRTIHLVSLRFLDTETHIVLVDCWKTAPGRRTLLRFILLGPSCLLRGWPSISQLA